MRQGDVCGMWGHQRCRQCTLWMFIIELRRNVHELGISKRKTDLLHVQYGSDRAALARSRLCLWDYLLASPCVNVLLKRAPPTNFRFHMAIASYRNGICSIRAQILLSADGQLRNGRHEPCGAIGNLGRAAMQYVRGCVCVCVSECTGHLCVCLP